MSNIRNKMKFYQSSKASLKHKLIRKKPWKEVFIIKRNAFVIAIMYLISHEGTSTFMIAISERAGCSRMNREYRPVHLGRP